MKNLSTYTALLTISVLSYVGMAKAEMQGPIVGDRKAQIRESTLRAAEKMNFKFCSYQSEPKKNVFLWLNINFIALSDGDLYIDDIPLQGRPGLRGRLTLAKGEPGFYDPGTELESNIYLDPQGQKITRIDLTVIESRTENIGTVTNPVNIQVNRVNPAKSYSCREKP